MPRPGPPPEPRASGPMPCSGWGTAWSSGSPGRGTHLTLYGHLDTVPAQGNAIPEARDGRVFGVGASDMKSGLAVMLALLEDAQVAAGPYRVAGVFYDKEEGPAHENGLEEVLDTVGWLGQAGLAVVLEPTDLELQLGCQGALNARVTFFGEAAHSARPWLGVNAITPGRGVAGGDARAPADPRGGSRPGVPRGRQRHPGPGRRRRQRDPGAFRPQRQLPVPSQLHPGGGRGPIAGCRRPCRRDRDLRPRPGGGDPRGQPAPGASRLGSPGRVAPASRPGPTSPASPGGASRRSTTGRERWPSATAPTSRWRWPPWSRPSSPSSGS